jgi:hypothetical protein
MSFDFRELILTMLICSIRFLCAPTIGLPASDNALFFWNDDEPSEAEGDLPSIGGSPPDRFNSPDLGD